jgi:hypothetical protein
MSGEMVPYPPSDDDLVPLTRCEQCGKLARPGHSLCDQHWGEQMLDAARARLRANALLAVDTLVEIAETSTDPERAKAAIAILDRAGLRHGLDVTVRAQPGESPAAILAERLARLRARVETPAELEAGEEAAMEVAISEKSTTMGAEDDAE